MRSAYGPRDYRSGPTPHLHLLAFDALFDSSRKPDIDRITVAIYVGCLGVTGPGELRARGRYSFDWVLLYRP